MSNKKSGSTSGDASGGKGRPTPKRNANEKNKAKVQEARNANRQWYMIIAALVLIVLAIIVLGTIFGDPYEPIQTQQQQNA